MLVLSCHRDEGVWLGPGVLVTVNDLRGDKARLGITAPGVPVVHTRHLRQIAEDPRAVNAAVHRLAVQLHDPALGWSAAGIPGSGVEVHRIVGRDCSIELQPRPAYCNRGNWLATIDATGELARELDHADGWPRYYFDLNLAKVEVEAWLVKRGQLPATTAAEAATCPR